MLVISIIEMLGIIACAMSGAILGIKKDLDLFGVLMLGVTTAVGGGIIRDIVIGNTPPVYFREPKYFIVSVIAGVFVLFFNKSLNKLNNVIKIFDAIGLGIFTAIGCNVAIQHDINDMFIVVSVGVITGIGGGILRDLFNGEIPFVFRKEIYAVASIIGSLLFYYSRFFVTGNIPIYLCFSVTLIIRLIAIKWNIHLPISNHSKLADDSINTTI